METLNDAEIDLRSNKENLKNSDDEPTTSKQFTSCDGEEEEKFSNYEDALDDAEIFFTEDDEDFFDKEELLDSINFDLVVSLNRNEDLPPNCTATTEVPMTNEEQGLLNPIDKFLQQQRMQLTNELRGLQFSNRPVTGSGTVNQLDEWFQNRLNNNNNNNQRNTSQPIVQREVFRPSSIQNEISQLGTSQRVSHVLSTSRATIERTLQRFVQQRIQQFNPANANTAPTRPVLVVQGSGNAPPAPPPIPALNQEQTNQRPNNGDPIRRAQPWLLSNNSQTPMEQITREQIIGEISELVHRQLVSSTLQSNFRTTLERRILDGLRRAGIEENRTRLALTNLARNNLNYQRNDFSHLGINAGNGENAGEDNLDSASSVNERRTQRVVVHNSKEIRELKNEMSELKNMLKLSFELQLDMQRALKQEINALISGTFHNTNSARLIQSSRPSNEGKCIICTEAQIDTVFYQCGHMCSCYVCSINLRDKGHNCPVCRAPIKDVLRTYRTSLD